MTAAILLTALVSLPAAPARAYDAAQSRVVTDNPADWTPNVVSTGSVRYLAQAGNIMVAGGNFTQVENAGSTTVLTRNNLFSFDATSGAVTPGFAPTVDALVHALVIAPDGQKVFVGGEFKHVNGVAKVALVELNLSDGSIVSTFAPPALDGKVFTMKLVGGWLYIGGSFAHVGANNTPNLARLNPVTGAIDKTFAATFSGTNNPRNPAPPMIIKMDISPNATRLVAIGNFMTVNGSSRPQIVMFDITGSAPTVVGWETDRFHAPCSDSFQTYMHDIDFSPDGTYFVVGTTGGAFDGHDQAIGCDSATRWETSATGTSLQPTWTAFTGGDTIWSIAVTGTAVYTGGHNRWMNNPYGNDSAGPGAVSRPGLSALDPTTGVPFKWNPTRTTGVGVFDLLATDQGLWIGHDTDYVGHEYHHKLAFFPISGGTAVPTATAGALPGDVYQLGSGPVITGSVGTCGQTSNMGSHDVVNKRQVDPARNPIAAGSVAVPSSGTAWSRVRGAFMLSGTLFTGWPNGQLCSSGFNGTSFGQQQPIDLLGNRFSGDLNTVTGMFFSNNRIYYTESGKSFLYYRAFVPESNIVGAESYTASGNVSGLDFSQVSGMLLSGSRLYYVTPSDGSMFRIDWNGTAPVGGTSVRISGPAVDGVNWASAGLFLYAGTTGPPVNQPPVANITTSCTKLVCNFSSSGSSDPDGTIASYAWTFGDGATSTQPSPSHTYAAAGTYSVRLTVTDDGGLTGTTTRSVSVSSAAALSFVGDSHAVTNATQSSVSMPTNVAAGDALVLALSTSASSPSNPSGSGWTLVDTRTAASLTSRVWSKVATSADLGSTVTITAPTTVKSVLSLLAYRGTATSPVKAFADQAETVSRTTHTTPTVTVPAGGGWVISFWAEKSSSTSTLTPAAGVTQRYAGCGTLAGHTCLLVADNAALASAGSTAGGVVATADSANIADTMWTLVLGP